MSINTILDQFRFEHLPANLQLVSQPFHDLAYDMAEKLPENGMLKISLLKLLESKDAAVRAVLL